MRTRVAGRRMVALVTAIAGDAAIIATAVVAAPAASADATGLEQTINVALTARDYAPPNNMWVASFIADRTPTPHLEQTDA